VTTAALLGLAACSGGPHSRASAGSTSRPSLSRPAALPAGVVGATAVPTDVANQPTLRANVTISSCARAPGGWAASGTARNPTATAVTYTVTVFFTTSSATVLGSATSKVTIPAHGSQEWNAPAKLTPANPTRCVLRGVGK
jgi:hypothetical protein